MNNLGRPGDRVWLAHMKEWNELRALEKLEREREMKNQLAVSGPLTREDSQSVDQEMMTTKDRTLMNAHRATQSCAPYVKEARDIGARMYNLRNEIDKIEKIHLELSDYSSGKRKEDVVGLRDLYVVEYLQKQEELMRYRDRLSKIREIINDILKKYEDKRSVADFMNGGTACKCKRSLKYKRRSLKHKRRSLKYKRRSHK